MLSERLCTSIVWNRGNVMMINLDLAKPPIYRFECEHVVIVLLSFLLLLLLIFLIIFFSSYHRYCHFFLLLIFMLIFFISLLFSFLLLPIFIIVKVVDLKSIFMCSLDSTPENIKVLKKRRVLLKLQRVADLVTRLSEPVDSEINMLQNAFDLVFKHCQPDLSDQTISVCLLLILYFLPLIKYS
jgi:hypothetical protein